MKEENQIELLIAKQLSGEASAEERNILREWIGESTANRKEYERLRNLWQGLHPPFSPHEIDAEKAWDQVSLKLRQERTQLKRILRFWQQAAAILFFPLIGMIAYLMIPEEKVKVSFQEVFAPYGTYTQITLPDNSKVWLNAGSSLSYPVQFVNGSRDVTLRGEGYFEVQSDRKNPFIVHTGQAEVRATGTAFVVEAYQADSTTAVTLVEGKVGLTLRKKSQLQLQPGERALYNHNTLLCQIEKTDPYKWYAWKDGLMVFRDDPLEYVFKRLGQTFNVEFVVMDKEIASQPYRATFRDESLTEILRLLKLTAPIRYVERTREASADSILPKRKLEVFKLK